VAKMGLLLHTKSMNNPKTVRLVHAACKLLTADAATVKRALFLTVSLRGAIFQRKHHRGKSKGVYMIANKDWSYSNCRGSTKNKGSKNEITEASF
jgi:hypothetical protein